VTADIVLGADGAFSRVRPVLASQKQVNFSQTYLDHGTRWSYTPSTIYRANLEIPAYKELCIPPGTDSDGAPTFQLNPPNALHIWPRGEFMMIALPNPDKYEAFALHAIPFVGSR